MPADMRGAYETLIGPLMGMGGHRHMVTDTTFKITATAIFAHDPIYDIGPILSEHFPEIKDPSDVRQVRAALETNFQKREAVFDEIENGDALETAYEAVSRLVHRVPTLNQTTPWPHFESQLRKIWGAAGQAIVSAVDRLATLIQSENMANLNLNRTDDPARQTETKRPVDVAPPAPTPTRSGGFDM